MRSRKLAPACLSLGSRRGSNLMRNSKSIKCFSPAPPDNLKHSKGSVCPQLFAEMKYSVASRKLWNFQTLKPPDTNFWVVPSPRFKFRNRDLRCTIHRNKPRLQYISLGFRFGHFLFLCFFWSLLLSVAICWIVIHGKSSDLFSEKSIHGPSTFNPLQEALSVRSGGRATSEVEEFPLLGRLRTWRQFSQLHFVAKMKYLASRQL